MRRHTEDGRQGRGEIEQGQGLITFAPLDDTGPGHQQQGGGLVISCLLWPCCTVTGHHDGVVPLGTYDAQVLQDGAQGLIRLFNAFHIGFTTETEVGAGNTGTIEAQQAAVGFFALQMPSRLFGQFAVDIADGLGLNNHRLEVGGFEIAD